jgi:hypothetical protein
MTEYSLSRYLSAESHHEAVASSRTRQWSHLGKKTIKQLIDNQTLLLKKYAWMARAVVTE